MLHGFLYPPSTALSFEHINIRVFSESAAVFIHGIRPSTLGRVLWRRFIVGIRPRYIGGCGLGVMFQAYYAGAIARGPPYHLAFSFMHFNSDAFPAYHAGWCFKACIHKCCDRVLFGRAVRNYPQVCALRITKFKRPFRSRDESL